MKFTSLIKHTGIALLALGIILPANSYADYNDNSNSVVTGKFITAIVIGSVVMVTIGIAIIVRHHNKKADSST